MKSHSRAQLPLAAPAPATRSHPGSERWDSQVCSALLSFQLCSRLGGWILAATSLQSQGEKDGQGESELLRRAVGLALPSKLLHVLDVTLETVPPRVHLHF